MLTKKRRQKSPRKPLEKKQCDVCNEWFKNVSTHKRQAHSEPDVDRRVDKQLESLLSQIKQLLRPYSAEIEVRTKEPMGTGKVEEVEIKARIKVNSNFGAR